MSYSNEIKCVKCHQNAETDPRFRNEFITSYPIRDKDGQIYCWDCYKNKSHCEGCQKSVANIKFPRSGQPTYPHCNGGVSYNCERISNNVEFICSKKCSEDIFNRKYQAWKDKLSQGWTKCEKCIKRVNGLIKWFEEDGIKNGGFFKEEKHQSRFIKLVPPGQGKLCLEEWGCKWGKEVGKPHRKEVQAQAQKYWETLSYEDRLKEVIRSRNAKQVAWGGKFENWTAEEIAAQNEVPSGIRQEFELKDCHRDCQDCRLDKDFHNSTGNAISLSINENSNIILREKEIELQRLERAEIKDYKRILELKQEINFLKNQQQNNFFSKDHWVIGILIFVLLGSVIFLIKRKNIATKVKQ